MGCASTPSHNQTPLMWEPNLTWWSEARFGKASLLDRQGNPIVISPQAVQSLDAARRRLGQIAGLQADLGLIDLELPNAFALEHESKPKVLVSLGLIKAFEKDPDVISFVLAHELAHHALGHVRGQARANREKQLQTANLVISNVASFFVPFSGLLVSQAVKGIGRSYSRDEEREADRLALKWLIEQNIDVCAAVRLNERLAPIAGSQISFLSTHPGFEERIDRVQQVAHKELGRQCDRRQ